MIENNEFTISLKSTWYNFDFLMWSGIHKYIYMVHSIHVGVVKHT